MKSKSDAYPLFRRCPRSQLPGHVRHEKHGCANVLDRHVAHPPQHPTVAAHPEDHDPARPPLNCGPEARKRTTRVNIVIIDEQEVPAARDRDRELPLRVAPTTGCGTLDESDSGMPGSDCVSSRLAPVRDNKDFRVGELPIKSPQRPLKR